MSKIIGNTTVTPVPKSNWLQTDELKADFILNKPSLGALAEKNSVEKSDLSTELQTTLVTVNELNMVLEAAKEEIVNNVSIEVDDALSDTSENPVQNKVVTNILNQMVTEFGEELKNKANVADYNESIIGLSIDGQIITYIKGDGSVHTLVTQDTNTTYSLGTDETTGLTKLYATTGSAEDGTMTQKAIKTELDKKVGVSMDDASATLTFTI